MPLKTCQQMIKHPLGILPPIVAVLKLLHVLLKVLRRNMDVRPADRKLEPRPIAFHRVDMAAVLRIFANAVIDRLMLVSSLGQPTVGFSVRRYGPCCPS